MKIIIDDLKEIYSENIMLVKTLMKRESAEEYPEMLKWKLQMLYFDGSRWIELCRIDNYLHEGQAGSHIHVYNKDEVKRVELTFEEADGAIKKISSKILKERFSEDIKFGDG